MLAAAALAGAITGLFAALLAARLWRGGGGAGQVDREEFAALARRCAALESDAVAQAESVEARMTAWRAQAHGIATVLRNLADAQRKAERAAEQRSAALIRRAADQVEHLADRVFTLEARLAEPSAGRDAAPAPDAPRPEGTPPPQDEAGPLPERARPEPGGPRPGVVEAGPEPPPAPDPEPGPPVPLDLAGLPSRVVSVVPR